MPFTPRLVLVTASSVEEARVVAGAVLEKKLAACVNILSGVESHYWWQGRLESSAEILMILKTPQARLAALEKLILARHPYDTPEFLALPLSAGNGKYLDWLSTNCRGNLLNSVASRVK